MLFLRVLFFLMICSVSSITMAQVTITEVMDSYLDGRDINGVSINSNGETILYDDEYIFTFVNGVTEEFYCNICYDILAVVAIQDTQYIARNFGGIIKRIGDSLEVIADHDASSLAIDKNGILYGNDYGNGFFRWNGSEVEHWNEANSNLPTDWVNELAVDSNGLVWLATHTGLISFNGSSFSPKSVPTNLSATLYDIAIDQNNAVWVSSAYGGVGRFANNSWTTFPQTFNVVQLVQDIAILHGQEVWTSSFDKGLYRYHNNQFTNYAPSEFGFSSFENCAFLFGDAQGRLWMDFNNTPLMYLTTGPTAIDEHQPNSNALSISPNPTDGVVHLSIPSEYASITSIHLFSSEGKLWYSSTSMFDHEVSLDISHLASGLYYAAVTDATGGRIFKKIILR